MAQTAAAGSGLLRPGHLKYKFHLSGTLDGQQIAQERKQTALFSIYVHNMHMHTPRVLEYLNVLFMRVLHPGGYFTPGQTFSSLLGGTLI